MRSLSGSGIFLLLIETQKHFIMKYSVLFIAAYLSLNGVQSQVKPLSIKIGNQTWMKVNLSTSRYRNGDPIPKVTDPDKWAALTTGAYCYYNNDSATYAATYGKLYNWYAVNDPRGLAPKGWHIPSDEEWSQLINFAGGEVEAGNKLKESGNRHFKLYNTTATNSSGFTGLPGGSRFYLGTFDHVGEKGMWWSATTVINSSNAGYRNLTYISANCYGNSSGSYNSGFSVRCVKD
jgi:uncharacterized protein (TIGR02145 family)